MPAQSVRDFRSEEETRWGQNAWAVGASAVDDRELGARRPSALPLHKLISWWASRRWTRSIGGANGQRGDQFSRTGSSNDPAAAPAAPCMCGSRC
jgi:hypothetical protein